MKHRCRYPHPHRFSNTEAMRPTEDLAAACSSPNLELFMETQIPTEYVRIFLECEKTRSNISSNVLLRKSLNGDADIKTR